MKKNMQFIHIDTGICRLEEALSTTSKVNGGVRVRVRVGVIKIITISLFHLARCPPKFYKMYFFY